MKIFVRELFWLVLSTVLSLILGFVFLELIELTSTQRTLQPIEQVFSVELYLIGCLISIVAIYIVRIIFIAIKMFTRD